MNILFFLIFGFLSSLLGNILGIIANIIGIFLTTILAPVIKLNRQIGLGLVAFSILVGFILVYIGWIIGTTTGLLIAEKYSNGNTIIYILFILVLAFLNFRSWKIYLEENQKNSKLNPYSSEFPNFENLRKIGNQLIFYAIMIPLILFSIKKSWASPFFSVIYDTIKGILPS